MQPDRDPGSLQKPRSQETKKPRSQEAKRTRCQEAKKPSERMNISYIYIYIFDIYSSYISYIYISYKHIISYQEAKKTRRQEAKKPRSEVKE